MVWETDRDVIRAVLPPPLEPSEPRARLRFATVDMGTGIPVFGAGWFGFRRNIRNEFDHEADLVNADEAGPRSAAMA